MTTVVEFCSNSYQFSPFTQLKVHRLVNWGQNSDLPLLGLSNWEAQAVPRLFGPDFTQGIKESIPNSIDSYSVLTYP